MGHMGMGQMGISWEGTKWKARSLPRETLGQRLGMVGRRLTRPLALGLFLATFPVLAISVMVFNPTPASSGSCSAYTTVDNSVRSRTEARCNAPYDHDHRVWTELLTNRYYGGGNVFEVIASAYKLRSQAEFSVETNSKWVGCADYYGRGGVWYQDQDSSSLRWYCR